MFVKPGPNPDMPGTLLKVRIPHTYALLPEEGQDVPEDGFWLQRLAHGDVVETERPPPAVESDAHEAAPEQIDHQESAA